MYTRLCLMEWQYILGGRMFPEKTNQTCNALTVHSQKSCGTQVQHSTGGAFETGPICNRHGGGGGVLMFICFDGAIWYNLFKWTQITLFKMDSWSLSINDYYSARMHLIKKICTIKLHYCLYLFQVNAILGNFLLQNPEQKVTQFTQ